MPAPSVAPVPAAASWLVVAGILAGLAVALGAFGAHAVRGWSAAWPEDSRQRRLENWEVAARYHMYHALALVGVAALAAAGAPRAAVAGTCFVVGTAIFSGCLYAYALTGQKWLGAVVPLGGALLILGWTAWVVSAARLAFRSG